MIKNTCGLREREQFGQKLRQKLKRSDQAVWKSSKRNHDPVEIILSVNRRRIAELVPIKMARMAISPFGFFRGNVPVVAADMAALPVTGILVQICGDAHVRNLGAYAAPDGRVIFDINDFDETLRAPWEWDLKRLATSLILAGREAQNSEECCHDAVLACAETYRHKMTEFSRMSVVAVHEYRIHRQFAGKTVNSVLQNAERAAPLHSLMKLTSKHGSSRAFKQNKPVLTRPPKSVVREVLHALSSYRETLSEGSRQALSFYTPVDVAFKVVGTGSVATRDYVVLHFAGGGVFDPLFLQVKEALPSAYAPYVRASEAPTNQGLRVVRGQRLLQVQSDIMLGWTSFSGHDYLVRQLSDHKGCIEDEDLKGTGLIDYATTCGEVIAKGHARSGDPAVLAGYLGTNDRWDKAMAKFAVTYADQTTRDCQAFREAIRIGKIVAGKPYL